jgi:hypothetical protein
MQISIPMRRTRDVSDVRDAARSVSSVRAGVWLAGFALLCFVYFLPRWHDYNQDARMDMTMSIVNFGTTNIDNYYLNTGDRDHFHGHYYSNKAPGQSLIGVPVYIAFDAALDVPPIRGAVTALEHNSAWQSALQDSNCVIAVVHDPCRFELSPRLDFALLQYVESVATAAIPSVLMLLLFFWFLGYFSSSLASRTLLTLGLGLATMIFPYSQEFYSHVPAASFDFVGFVLIYIVSARGAPRPKTKWLLEHRGVAMFMAGVALGSSVVLEYPAAIVVGLIGIYALFALPRALLLPLASGLIPPLALVMSYNYSAYHDPLTTGYGCYDTHWPGECKGIGGFTWPPSGAALREMTVGRYRGLFFLSPFLLLAVPGFFLWFMRSRRDRSTVLLFAAIPVLFLFAIACYWGWNGGQVVGPRYLMELMPFLALPVIFVLDGLKSPAMRLGVLALVAISAVNIWAETIGGRAFARGGVDDPLFKYSLPQLAHGHVPLNLGTFIGLSGPTTLAPLALALALWSVGSFAIKRYKLSPQRSPFRVPG